MNTIKRIAILHPQMEKMGGAENLILWTAVEWARRGLQVTLFARSFHPEIPKEIVCVPAAFDLKVSKMGKTARWLAEKLSGFDAVVFHNFPASVYFHLARKAAAKRSLKFPVSLFYCHEPCRPWYGKNPDECRAARRRHFLRFDLPALNNIRLDKLGVAKADFAVANSRRSADFASWVFGRPFDVAYPGIPAEMIENENGSAVRDRFVFLGQLTWIKNIRSAVLAYGEFLKRRPDSKIDLVVIGEGPEEAAMKELVSELNIKGRVHFEGHASRAGIDSHFSKALAVLFIPMAEPFGLVCLESWAKGAPVVLAEDSGVAEGVRAREEAILVEAQSVETIAAAMADLTNDFGLGKKLSAGGLERLKAGYLISHHAERLLSILATKPSS